jgi:hypothetical protein
MFAAAGGGSFSKAQGGPLGRPIRLAVRRRPQTTFATTIAVDFGNPGGIGGAAPELHRASAIGTGHVDRKPVSGKTNSLVQEHDGPHCSNGWLKFKQSFETASSPDLGDIAALSAITAAGQIRGVSLRFSGARPTFRRAAAWHRSPHAGGAPAERLLIWPEASAARFATPHNKRCAP